MLSSQFDQSLSEHIVKLLLLHGIVESRMAKVFFSVGDKKLLKLDSIGIKMYILEKKQKIRGGDVFNKLKPHLLLDSSSN